MDYGAGAVNFSRHAQKAADFGDVLAGEDDVRDRTDKAQYAGTSSSTSTEASQAASFAPSLRPASAAHQLGRTIGRGAPLFSAPRIENAWGAESASVSTGFPARADSHVVNAQSSDTGRASGGLLSEALRERERKALQQSSVYDPTQQLAVEREREAVRGVYATPYDPASDRHQSREPSKGDLSGTERTVSGSSPPPDGAGRPGGAAASGNSSEPMPIAPINIPGPKTYVEASPAVLDMSDMRRFLMNPVPKGSGVVQCYIDRDKSSITNMLYPVYVLSFRDRFLLAGKKRTYNKTSNYLMSMDKRDLSRESPAFLGKVRSNLVGTEYVLYDDGEGLETRTKTTAGSELRQELGVVCYASNVLGSRGPRKMKVAVPKLTDGRRIVFQPDREDDTMLSKFRAGYIQDMFLMINKPPKWNDQVGAYVLNFNGRVTMASVKNFQLVSPDDHDTVVLQFGRTGRDTFTMDFQWPLSPLQAFAICMSSFDYKLACE